MPSMRPFEVPDAQIATVAKEKRKTADETAWDIGDVGVIDCDTVSETAAKPVTLARSGNALCAPIRRKPGWPHSR